MSDPANKRPGFKLGPAIPHPQPPQPALPVEVTAEMRTDISAWLDKHWTNWDCPFHGTTTWTVGDLIHGAQAYHPVGVASLNKSYPNVVVICNECGYSVLVNAIKMGIYPSDKPSEAGAE